MYHIHTGVKKKTARILGKYFNEDELIIDGDGWNAWGEAPGTDMNDADTLHVVIPCNTSLSGARAVALRVFQLRNDLQLVPASVVRNGKNVVVALTDARDWSEVHMVLFE